MGDTALGEDFRGIPCSLTPAVVAVQCAKGLVAQAAALATFCTGQIQLAVYRENVVTLSVTFIRAGYEFSIMRTTY